MKIGKPGDLMGLQKIQGLQMSCIQRCYHSEERVNDNP